MTKEKLANLSDVRKANCKLIFDTLYRQDGMTLLDIEQSTGLSRPTVVGMVRAMEEVELVKALGKRESNGGRTPFIYGINPDAYYAIGIDFEFPVSRVAIANLKGMIVGNSKEEFPSELCAEEVIERLLKQINEAVKQSGIDESRFLGIGLGMPGYINLRSGLSRRFERISDWKNIEIVKHISEGTGLPVYMENDVHLLFRAERELWKRKNNQDALFIAIRSGIGSAIFQRGHIIEGEYGNAGHIGHTIVHVGGEKCTCGNSGCLELYASERAICKNYEKLTGTHIVSVEEIVAKAQSGEAAAENVLKEAGRYLGVGIGNAVNMLDIHTIIVSSYFDSSIILESAQKELDSSVNLSQEKKAQIYPGRLPEAQFALGGCKLVFRRNQNEILTTVPLKNL